jgi:hypothetical protein
VLSAMMRSHTAIHAGVGSTYPVDDAKNAERSGQSVAALRRLAFQDGCEGDKEGANEVLVPLPIFVL